MQIVAPSLKGEFSGVTGPEILVKDMMSHWQNYNIEVLLIYDRHGRHWDYFQQSGCQLLDYKIGGKFSFISIFRLARIAKKYCVDVIHTNGQPVNYIAAIASQLTNIPLVINRHITMNEYRVNSVKCFFYELVDKLTLQWSKKVIATSQAGMDHLIAKKTSLSVKTRLIHTGIPLERFPMKPEESISSKPFTLGFVGRLSEEKGCPDFLRVIRRLLDSGYDVRGLIVGDGPDAAEYKDMANAFALTDFVEFSGFHENIQPLLSDMDIFLLTSFREGFPAVILEAMASGIPVVATRVEGIPEQIIEGKNGFLAEPGDIDKMVEHCVRLIEDRDLRIEFARNSRKRVEEYFPFDSMVEKYAECFREAAADRVES